MTLTLTPLKNVPLIYPGDDLIKIVIQSLGDTGIKIENGDILVFAQKIISKAEGRLFDLSSVKPSLEAHKIASEIQKDPRLVELILKESNCVIRTKPGTIIVEHRLGFVCANAGIDHSNVKQEDSNNSEFVTLLPENPDRSARKLRENLESLTSKRIGVLIIDSHGRAWRLGTVGITIGISGLPGIVDLIGFPDIFNTKLQNTYVGASDELAAAASLTMGQAAEGTPIVHVRGFPYQMSDSSLNDILRPHVDDLFR